MMGCCKNRRTLRRRVRRVMWLCILVTILLFGTAVIWMEAERFRGESRFWAECFGGWIAEEINSDYFKSQIGIKDLKDYNVYSSKAKLWAESMNRKWGDPRKIKLLVPEDVHEKIENDQTNFASDLNGTILVMVVLDNQMKPIYQNYLEEDYYYNLLEHRPNGDFFRGLQARLLNYFTSESYKNLFDNKRKRIGYVKVLISPNFAIMLFTFVVGMVFFLGLLSLILANFIARFLTYPIIGPITKLQETFREIAGQDLGKCKCDRVYISVKKPLKEIEELIDSTNMIVDKMAEYSDLLAAQNNELESQRDELEAQNEELEAQNEELVKSQRQIQEAQALLVQSEQMASVGQLTAAIAHEINTPLGAIHSNVQMFEMLLGQLKQGERLQTDPELAAILSQLEEANSVSMLASRKVSEIIKSLKTYSKIDRAEFQEADINEGIRSVMVLTSNLWKRRITIHEDYAVLPMIKCFPGMLNQVFMNIVVNAIQAIGEKGDIHIRTYMENEKVKIGIRDNGSGIRPEHLSQIFDPGFSTKKYGVGMGLGLSICQNIVNKHHGEITVTSEVGKGTEFVVSIPIG